MNPSQFSQDLALAAHGMFVAAMFIAQAIVPFVTLLLALRAL